MAADAPAPFIVGMSRSGTTLLRMMLDSHPALAIPPETNFGLAIRAYREKGAELAVEAIVRSPFWQDTGLPAADFARAVEAREPADLGGVLRIFYELYAERSGKPRWGDKTPFYIARMTELQGLLPEARFVHVVRDGRDVALSLVPLWFGPSDVAGVAEKWSRRLVSARRQARELSSYTEVRYEDLVRDPNAVLRRLCELLELDWDASMLDYHHRADARLAGETVTRCVAGRVVSRDERLRIHRFLGSPPRPDRIERWRREMSAADVRAFESVAGETLEEFGYELS